MSKGNKILEDIKPDQQGDLLNAPEGECGGAPTPLGKSPVWKAMDGELDDDATAKRGPGRPAGSTNKKSQTLQKWLLGLGYRHPAVLLAEITARPVEELAAQLGCDKLEAFQEQRKAASDLLPYFEGRILPKTDQGEQPLPQLHLHLDVDQVGLAGAKVADEGPILLAKKIEVNQEVSYSDVEPSHDDSVANEVSD